MARKIEKALYAIKTDTSWGCDTIIEADNDHDMMKYIAKLESKNAVVLGVKQISPNGSYRVGFRSDPYFKNWKKGYELVKICKKYGFKVFVSNNQICINAKNRFEWVTHWFSYTPNLGLFIKGNTDKLNLWLCDTRPDLTADKVVEFVSEVNKILSLKGENRLTIKKLIAPEDWQEIAKVDDAFKDKRYK